MKKYSRKESMQFLDISYLRERQLQYDLIKELEGTLDHYIESRYVDPYEYLKSRLKTISKTILKDFLIDNKTAEIFILVEGLTEIGPETFYQYENLKEIYLPESLKIIGDNAFYYCISLTGIEIPNNVETIGDYAFANREKLTKIKIPNSVQNIKEYTFYHCADLTRMEIPNNVKTIGKYAFSHCKNLKEIVVDNTAEFVFMNWDMNWNANCNAIVTYLR